MFDFGILICISLIVVSFLIPPIGVIDNSVLTAVGLLIKVFTIKGILKALNTGRSVKIKSGDFSAEVGSNHN